MDVNANTLKCSYRHSSDSPSSFSCTKLDVNCMFNIMKLDHNQGHHISLKGCELCGQILLRKMPHTRVKRRIFHTSEHHVWLKMVPNVCSNTHTNTKPFVQAYNCFTNAHITNRLPNARARINGYARFSWRVLFSSDSGQESKEVGLLKYWTVTF